jgi:predicted dehydrogenase
VADRFNVPHRYADYEQMLGEQRPDLICIATPQWLHAQMTVLAATRYSPKAILCEKAMANNLGEAQAMLAACDANQVKLAIGHVQRWREVYQRARSMVASGAIGTPLFARVAVGDGGLMNNGTHLISYMLYVLGDPQPEWVIGNVQRDSDRFERGWPVEELGGALVGVAGGVRMSVESDIPGEPRPWEIVTGSAGMMIWPYIFEKAPFTLRLLRADGRIEETRTPVETLEELFHRQLRSLAEWARGEVADNPGDARLALATQEVLMAIYESARTHTLVRLPLETRASPLLEMIRSGDLPVRQPGRYDIRHRTELPR